jgi:glycosyltransferase involved in cell wall biosynthesis
LAISRLAGGRGVSRAAIGAHKGGMNQVSAPPTPARPQTCPEICCVVPAFQSAPLLARTLMSIVTQFDITPDVVVVDDSTEPGVRTLVEGLAGLFPNIRYFPGARTGNPVDNWNVGLNHARGRFLMVVHHDDFFCDAGFLRRAVDRLASGEGEVLVAGHGLAGRPGRSRFSLASFLARRLKLKPWSLYAINWLGPPSVMMFAAEPKIRFDARLCWLVDVDFYARLLKPGVRLICDAGVSLISLRHADQITARVDSRMLTLRELQLLRATDRERLGPWPGLLLAYAACRVSPWLWRRPATTAGRSIPNARVRTDS